MLSLIRVVFLSKVDIICLESNSYVKNLFQKTY